MIKLVAIDMDGTLLREDCTISERTKKTIEKAVERGYYIVPTTGRCYQNSQEVLKDFQGLSYYINANGTTITKANGELIFSECFSYEQGREVYDKISTYECFLELYSGKEAYVDSYGMQYLYDTGLPREYCDQILGTNIRMKSLDDFIEDENRRINKFHVLFNNIDRKFQLLRELEKMDGVYPVSVVPQNMEIVREGWNKAKGLEKLGDLLGIKREEIMAIGDSDNDYEMLDWAGTTVAMANGNDHVKKIVDYVTTSNNEDGVAVALEKYLEL